MARYSRAHLRLGWFSSRHSCWTPTACGSFSPEAITQLSIAQVTGRWHQPCYSLLIMGESAIKVVIEQRTLRGPSDGNSMQQIATVYIDGAEYRVYAPPRASGNPLDWLEHLRVRRPSP